MKKLITLSLIILACLLPAQTLKDRISDKSSDAFEETENDNLTLHFFNALTGAEINNADVSISGIGEFKSSNGAVLFPAPEEDGVYKVSFNAAGFIDSKFKIEVMSGSIFFNRFSVSPIMDIKNFRVVLDWDKAPDDLDAHFIKENSFHISYRNTKTLADGSGKLDRDDLDGYGPETITLGEVSKNGSYEFFVHDFSNKSQSNSDNLSNSKATVKVYGNGKLLNILEIPRDIKGTVWKAFKIENGEIVIINEISK